jgi:hypothetical protein
MSLQTATVPAPDSMPAPLAGAPAPGPGAAPRLRPVLPLVGAAALLGILELLVYWPGAAATWFAAAVLSSAATGVFVGWSEQGRLPRLHVWLPPALLAAASFGLILFLETAPRRQAIAAFTAALAALFWESTRRFLRAPDRYHREQFETAARLLALATVWFMAATFFRLLLDPSVLPSQLARSAYVLTTLCLLVAVFFLEGWALAARPPERAEPAWPFRVAATLVIAETFWFVNFLPVATDVKGFLVALTAYAVSAFSHAHLDGTLSWRVARRYVALLAAALAAVLATARWLV